MIGQAGPVELVTHQVEGVPLVELLRPGIAGPAQAVELVRLVIGQAGPAMLLALQVEGVHLVELLPMVIAGRRTPSSCCAW